MKTLILLLAYISYSFAVINSSSTNPKSFSKNYHRQDSTKKYFHVKDSTLYSKQFLNYWKEKYSSVEIIEDSIIINHSKENCVIIPASLPLKKKVEYFSSLADTLYKLEVSRINYSELEYEFRISVNKNITFQQIGIADLEGSFYLGAEGVFEHNGATYPLNDFNHSTDSTYTTIKIGEGSLEKSIFVLENEDNKAADLKVSLDLKK